MTSAVTNLDSSQICYQVASLLLSYPDEELLGRLPVLRAAIAETPFAPAFAATFGHLESQSLTESQSFHVQEFDISRRHALHLSYWTDGDTRRRGEVLAGIKQVYRDSGLLVDLGGELPDHLPLVLEFAALGDPQRGTELLTRYRPSLELLRMQLERDDLPQAGILQALCSTLPGRSPSTRAEVQAMVDAAMPVEQVGLEGYGGDFLGMPTATPDAIPTPAAEPVEAPRPSLISRLTGRSKEKKQ
ncbi:MULTISPECIES: nitrate reductase molybdenum cofactor assembly chaperone [unclassified Luteococcus]|uniref:nitrate reductase molybdenum cofactor assembly chaperone n=1 Tax=unclassified Luteococcus TaxID=2639923 RepID=UPI00313E0313